MVRNSLLAAIIASMPLIPGQGAGLVAGIVLVVFYMVCYAVMQYVKKAKRSVRRV
jgi:AAT family amino acid transporter